MRGVAVFGSIGVANYSSAPKSVGMFDGWQDAITTSSNAPNKIPDPHTEQGRAAIQQEIDVIETDFIAAVAMGRKKTIEQVAENFGRGGVMSGRAAVSVGMIDRTIRLDEYVAELGGQRGGNARAAMAAAFG